MRHGELGERHHLEDVAAERGLNAVDLDVLVVLAHDLFAGVIDKNVETTVLLHVGIDDLVQVPQPLKVKGDELAFAAGGLDETLGLLGVLLLRREVHDGAVATLASVEGSYSTANVAETLDWPMFSNHNRRGSSYPMPESPPVTIAALSFSLPEPWYSTNPSDPSSLMDSEVGAMSFSRLRLQVNKAIKHQVLWGGKPTQAVVAPASEHWP